eukprot:scaffold17778_cov22-Tisochrysis_lutea.AAC.2
MLHLRWVSCCTSDAAYKMGQRLLQLQMGPWLAGQQELKPKVAVKLLLPKQRASLRSHRCNFLHTSGKKIPAKMSSPVQRSLLHC